MNLPKEILDKLTYKDIDIIARWICKKIIDDNRLFKKEIIELLDEYEMSLCSDLSFYIAKKESEK